MWTDHGFLRLKFQNLHMISAEGHLDKMWRSNQPSPKQIKEHVDLRGLKTIINLRGESGAGFHVLEREACDIHGVELVNFQMFSRDTPTKEKILEAKALFERIEYPALMHCKSGADRAGIMAVLFKLLHEEASFDEAIKQLSFKYLHIKEGKTGMLDHFFEVYRLRHEETGIGFLDWIENEYDRHGVKDNFMSKWWGNMLTDKLLRRE